MVIAPGMTVVSMKPKIFGKALLMLAGPAGLGALKEVPRLPGINASPPANSPLAEGAYLYVSDPCIQPLEDSALALHVLLHIHSIFPLTENQILKHKKHRLCSLCCSS